MNIEKISEAANQRLQKAFSANRSTLFICHSLDSEQLARRISSTHAFKGRDYKIATEDDAEELESLIESSSLIIAYVDGSQQHSIINKAIEVCAGAKRQILFVKGREDAIPPNYVLQFRVRTLSWSQLVEILIG